MLGKGTRWATLFVAMGLLASVDASEVGCKACCGKWDASAHALYFTPISGPYDYANAFFDVPDGAFSQRQSSFSRVPCQADWGFRVFGNYHWDCLFLRASYQWVKSVASNGVTSGDELSIRGGNIRDPGRAIGRVSIEYQNFDLRLGTYLLQSCRSAFYVYGNGRWVNLGQWRSIRYTQSATGFREQMHDHSTLQGGAIGVGFGSDYSVGCGLGAFVDGNLLGVIGTRDYKDPVFEDSQTFFRYTNGHYSSPVCIFPELDVRIGIDYSYQCGSCTLVGEIGYELDYFFSGVALVPIWRVFSPNTASAMALSNQDIGFSGLFFGARVFF